VFVYFVGCRNGASLGGDSIRGAWSEGSFAGDPERYVKEIYQERCRKCPVSRYLSP
jgi:hypothetical protein